MPYVPFERFFPEIAEQETRVLTVLPGSNLDVPPAQYAFLEMFCDEVGCDCRRVMFSVHSSLRNDFEAVVAWGWEDRAFYARWLGFGDNRMLDELQGPVLNLASPQSCHSGAILRLTRDVLLRDTAYVERVKRHYALFREHVERMDPGRTGVEATSGPAEPRGARESSRERRARRRQAWEKRPPGRKS
jgi:hypothetical protein